MTDGYHLLQFVPDPFTETAITFGALVETNGLWRFEAAVPGERVLPAALPPAATTLFRSLLAELRDLKAPRLPLSLGQHVRLRPRLELPAGIVDPAHWVTRNALPTSEIAHRSARRQQRARRATIGRLFLREYKVAKLVKSHFKAEMLGARAHSMKPVSQYVVGGRETMLLEPLFLDADRFEHELQDVTGTLFAWESLTRQRERRNLTFSVYALGTSKRNLQFLTETFAGTDVVVVDTAARDDRQRFLSNIRSLAEGGALHS